MSLSIKPTSSEYKSTIFTNMSDTECIIEINKRELRFMNGRLETKNIDREYEIILTKKETKEIYKIMYNYFEEKD